MRFSIWPGPHRPWKEIVDLVTHCEAAGWDGAYFADHFMPNTADGSPDDGPTMECWAVMAALAHATTRLRLGTLVCGNTYRHPAVLAKIATGVDNISGGRLLLGFGAGWQINEHRAYGIELYDTKARLDRFEEACTIVKSMLAGGRTTFKGKHYRVTDAPCEPGPVNGHLPLLIGGGGERRTLRIAAQFADEWNCWSTPEIMRHKLSVLGRHCADIGRELSEIAVSTQALLYMSDDKDWVAERRTRNVGQAAVVGTPAEVVDIIGEYAEAGVKEFIVPDFTLGPPERRRAICDQFITEVAPAFR
jgi:F420-dependent oxidoreductase-like protein